MTAEPLTGGGNGAGWGRTGAVPEGRDQHLTRRTKPGGGEVRQWAADSSCTPAPRAPARRHHERPSREPEPPAAGGTVQGEGVARGDVWGESGHPDAATPAGEPVVQTEKGTLERDSVQPASSRAQALRQLCPGHWAGALLWGHRGQTQLSTAVSAWPRRPGLLLPGCGGGWCCVAWGRRSPRSLVQSQHRLVSLCDFLISQGPAEPTP